MQQTFRTIVAALGIAFSVAAPATAATVTVEGITVDTLPQVTGTYQFAHGFGLIYGAMPVARQLGIVEKMLPNAKIEWQNIFTTAQQRDAMLAGRLHFGSCTPGPFLQSWDKGVDWKWVQTTGGFDGYLMVRKDGPNSVLEFIGTTKKMSPGPNTAQYFTVQELLRKAGKDVKALTATGPTCRTPTRCRRSSPGSSTGTSPPRTSRFGSRKPA
jgi:ABC-type nitrate/sulfonate/bicarbonate transport system substrate-binding protein